ncbi:hypothetical protein BH24CHL7_BH24CHL7_02070 [soil metagenome]
MTHTKELPLIDARGNPIINGITYWTPEYRVRPAALGPPEPPSIAIENLNDTFIQTKYPNSQWGRARVLEQPTAYLWTLIFDDPATDVERIVFDQQKAEVTEIHRCGCVRQSSLIKRYQPVDHRYSIQHEPLTSRPCSAHTRPPAAPMCS